MAITKVSQYNSTPTAVSDYQAQNAHLQAFINQLNGSVSVLNQSATTVVPTIKQGSYISMGGTAYIVDTEDYTILGSLSSGLNYIKLAVSGENLTATWINSLSGYSWNAIYNYYSDGTNALLPYAINYSSSNYYISQFDRTFNQGLKTTDDVVFNSLNTQEIRLSYLDVNAGDVQLVRTTAETTKHFTAAASYNIWNQMNTEHIYLADFFPQADIINGINSVRLKVYGKNIEDSNLRNRDGGIRIKKNGIVVFTGSITETVDTSFQLTGYTDEDYTTDYYDIEMTQTFYATSYEFDMTYYLDIFIDRLFTKVEEVFN